MSVHSVGVGGMVMLALLAGAAVWVPREALVVALYVAQGYVLLSCLRLFLPVAVFGLWYGSIKRLFRPPVAPPNAQPATRFLLLIPAHNEEKLLPGLLRSIQRQQYPPDLYKAVVIADNCWDGTVAVARRHQIRCLERYTAQASDKTQALQYAVEMLPIEAPFGGTVVCIIDADCKLDRTYLAELDKAFTRPGAALVMQSYRYVSNTFASPVTVLDAAAEALRQWLLSGTRKLLGQESFIYGLGCVMRDEVFADLMRLPGYTLAEDKDWKAHLLQHNVRVDFCPTARLSYEVVESGSSFQKQRHRWLAGHWEALRKYALPMLGQGIWNGKMAQLDFACELLQLPRSVLVLAAAGFGLLALWLPEASLLGPGVWGALVVAFFLYGMLGLWLIKAQRHHYLVLFSGVRLVLSVATTIGLLLLGRGIRIWEATRRPRPQAVPIAPHKP